MGETVVSESNERDRERANALHALLVYGKHEHGPNPDCHTCSLISNFLSAYRGEIEAGARRDCPCGKDTASIQHAYCYNCRQQQHDQARREGFEDGQLSAGLQVAQDAFERGKREGAREVLERAARAAEEHTEHIDFASPGGMGDPTGQSHFEPPYRCKVAEAIRALAEPEAEEGKRG